uniref:Uncharacterized protein n=1 Tax=Anopheles farauti TaxID=69004 RepID=A0A182QQA0_9DIPT
MSERNHWTGRWRNHHHYHHQQAKMEGRKEGKKSAHNFARSFNININIITVMWSFSFAVRIIQSLPGQSRPGCKWISCPSGWVVRDGGGGGGGGGASVGLTRPGALHIVLLATRKDTTPGLFETQSLKLNQEIKRESFLNQGVFVL